MSKLFKPVAEREKLDPRFKQFLELAASEPCRRMLEEIFETFEDPDGNFVEQFQTTGFDARFFELYLFAYFARSGFDLDRNHPNPDFLVSRNGLTVAVEATTVNPSESGVLSKVGKRIEELSPAEVSEYQENELAIRFGGPLFSKLKKRYWELSHCEGIPFVLAIEAFHDEQSLLFADSALTNYVFGLRHEASFSNEGSLEMDFEGVSEHAVGEKWIPSSLFTQPGTEFLSAVVFTNSGTHGKFSRMGFQHGFGTDLVEMRRIGFCANEDPDAMDPTLFSYDLAQPPFVETWGQGLVVLHNPKCNYSVPNEFFVDAVQLQFEDGVVHSYYSGWHPFSSLTQTVYVGKAKKELPDVLLRRAPVAVGAIPKKVFQNTAGFAVAGDDGMIEEKGWYSDDTSAFLGVVYRDKNTDEWGYVVLARDQNFHFWPIRTTTGFPARSRALTELQPEIVELCKQPQRLFSR